MTGTREETKVFLNTWGAYNDGCIGYGWMTPDEARDFIDDDPERDGGEWFVSDIENCFGVDFGLLEYVNVVDVLETIETLEGLDDSEIDNVVALMEYKSTKDAMEAIDDLDSYTFFSDIEEYHDSCDECLELDESSTLARYFDWDAFHRDCDFDIYEASNGVCVLG